MTDREKAAIKLPLTPILLFVLGFVLQETMKSGNLAYILPSALVTLLTAVYFIYLLIKYRWSDNQPSEQ